MALVTCDCTFRSGKMGRSFDCTAVGTTLAIITKDSTQQTIYIEQVYLSCGSGAKLALWDGSGATGTMKIAHSADSSGALMNMMMDFGKDSIVCDDGSSVCISAAADGAVWGFIKYYWG